MALCIVGPPTRPGSLSPAKCLRVNNVENGKRFDTRTEYGIHVDRAIALLVTRAAINVVKCISA